MTDRSQRNTLGVVPLVAAAMLLLGACQSTEDPSVAAVGGPNPSAAPADRAKQVQRYRDCLTQHGVRLVDDPADERLAPIDKEHTEFEVIEDATEKCQNLVPAGGEATEGPAVDLETLRKFSVCVREHGVPDYPDPDPVDGEPKLSEELTARLKTDPTYAAAERACIEFLPGAGKGTVGG